MFNDCRNCLFWPNIVVGPCPNQYPSNGGGGVKSIPQEVRLEHHAGALNVLWGQCERLHYAYAFAAYANP